MHQNLFSAEPPDPAGRAYDAPPDPLVGWGGDTPSPIPCPLGRLELSAYGASVLMPPQRKILAMPVLTPVLVTPERRSPLTRVSHAITDEQSATNKRVQSVSRHKTADKPTEMSGVFDVECTRL